MGPHPFSNPFLSTRPCLPVGTDGLCGANALCVHLSIQPSFMYTHSVLAAETRTGVTPACPLIQSSWSNGQFRSLACSWWKQGAPWEPGGGASPGQGTGEASGGGQYLNWCPIPGRGKACRREKGGVFRDPQQRDRGQGWDQELAGAMPSRASNTRGRLMGSAPRVVGSHREF